MVSEASDYRSPVISAERHESNSDTDSKTDRLKRFGGVLENVRLDRLPGLCSSVLRQHERWRAESLVDPVVGEQPLFGSYHVLFPVNFQGGPRMLLKIPACGTRSRFTEADSQSLNSEALTMRFLRNNTTMPLPEVFAFEASINNEIGCPFILIEFVSGISLADSWFDKTCSADELRQRRLRTLKDVADAMAQLGNFSYDLGGSIMFDRTGQSLRVGPSRLFDHKATLDRSFAGDGDDSPVYITAGPWSSVLGFYTRYLDMKDEPSDSVDRGLQRLNRKLLDLVPEPQDPRKNFVLAHPDFDIQNFIVAEDGALKAIIDWDGIEAVPRSVGNECYPGWLTRDWDPAMYGWNESMERDVEPVEPVGCWEDSPATLQQHRKDYDSFMRSSLLAEQQLTEASSENSQPDAEAIPSNPRTASSLFMENLLIATSNILSTQEILDLFINKITGANVREAPDDFDLFDLVDVLADGELDDERSKYLQDGLHSLFQKGNA